MILMMSSCSLRPISVLTFRLRYSMYSTWSGGDRRTPCYKDSPRRVVRQRHKDARASLYLFVVGHGAPRQFVQVAVRVGFGLPLGEQTGRAWHARDDVREDIAATGNVTSWQLGGGQKDRSAMTCADDNNKGRQTLWEDQRFTTLMSV